MQEKIKAPGQPVPVSRAIWESIPVAQRTPMQHFIWAQACFETLYDNDGGEVFTVQNEGRTHAAALFAKQGVFPGRLLLVGAEEIGEPVDVVYADADAAAAAFLAEKILRRGKPLRFGHFPAQSPFVAALTSKAAGKGILLSAPINGSPYIVLDEGWKEPEQRFNARRRSDLRRMMRKAEALGEVRFESLSPTPHNVDQLLDAAITVEAKSWKARSKTALAHNSQQESFFRRYARLASEEGALRICMLKIGAEIAAVQIAVEYDNAFWLFKIGYNEKYAACSPGNLLMLETIRDAAIKGLSRYELLGKAASWTRVWTENEHPNIRLRYYPHSFEGYAALFIDTGQVGLGRVKNLFQKILKKEKG